MSPGLEPFTQFEDWYQSPLGREVAAQEAACLEGMLEGIFGHYLLQVGGAAGFGEVVAASPIRHRILLPAAVHRAELGMQIVASPEHLPVASDSLDAVLLAHSLDFAPDPRQVLREAERVLIPEGRLLILGFNALSPWGLWSLALDGPGLTPVDERVLPNRPRIHLPQHIVEEDGVIGSSAPDRFIGQEVQRLGHSRA